jgi:hypothetical protein
MNKNRDPPRLNGSKSPWGKAEPHNPNTYVSLGTRKHFVIFHLTFLFSVLLVKNMAVGLSCILNWQNMTGFF